MNFLSSIINWKVQNRWIFIKSSTLTLKLVEDVVIIWGEREIPFFEIFVNNFEGRKSIYETMIFILLYFPTLSRCQ